MKTKIEINPLSEKTSRPAEKRAPRAGLRIRTELHVGEEEENDDYGATGMYDLNFWLPPIRPF